MGDIIKILFVDDDEEDYIITRNLFSEIKDKLFKLEWTSDFNKGLTAAIDQEYDAYLVDYRLGRDNGLDLIKKAVAQGCVRPLFLLTGKGDRDIDINAIKAGAADYIEKNQMSSPMLHRLICYAIERKKAEEALLKSEQHYKRITEKLTDYFFTVHITDNKLINTVHSPLFTTLTGYTNEEYESSPHLWIGIIFEEDRSIVFEQMSNLVSGKTVSPIEHRIRTKAGEIRWVRNIVIPFYDKKGVMLGYDGVISDITEAKLAAERQKAYMRMISRRNKELNSLYRISRYIENPGNSLDDVFQQTVRLIPNALEYPDIARARIIFNNKEFTTENFAESSIKLSMDIIISGKREGVIETFYIQEQYDAEPVKFSDEEKQYIESISRTLSTAAGREFTQTAMRESEKRYRLLAENQMDVILTMNSNLKFTYISPSITRQFGYTVSEAMNMSIYQLVASSSLENLSKIIQEETTIEQKGDNPARSRTIEIEISRRDKEPAWAEFTISYIRNPAGKIMSILGILRDITDRRAAEEEVRRHRDHLEEMVKKRTQELEEINDKLLLEIYERQKTEEKVKKSRELAETANRAKSEFLANMSHELRTPLNSIIGFSKLLKMGYDDETYKEHVDNIITSGTHLLKVINDILDLSKIEAGKMEFISKPVSLYDTLTHCMTIMSIQAENKNIQIEKQFEDLSGIKVLGDRKRLEQVFLNLLSNAVKFTGEGGKIRILSHVEYNFVEVSIIDNGIGIKEEFLEYIFEKFYQAETGFAKDSQGTGLGLAIAQKILTAHNGSIFVKSKEGHGSTFTVRIPRTLYFGEDAASA